jgi:hypothetical protein
MATPNWVAGGDIRPSRFVKQSTAADHTVLEADAGERVCGISQEGGREPPLPSVSTVYAGQAGDHMAVYGDGDQCLLELGSGGCTRGDRLKADADGKGVTAATAGNHVGAIALMSGAENEKIRVQVQIGLVPA